MLWHMITWTNQPSHWGKELEEEKVTSKFCIKIRVNFFFLFFKENLFVNVLIIYPEKGLGNTETMVIYPEP